MGAIYCEPCIAVRLQGSQAQIPPGTPVAAVPGAPNPGIAAFLGFIPGVGAMYNGQFMKGFIHVVIFVLLIIGADRFWGFGLMIGFFVFYMVFDAFKTAQAKQLGLPAPDPLGIDRMFGLQENHPPARPTASSPEADPFSSMLPPPPPTTQSNQPVGAIILIVLGVLFLLGNVIHFTMERFWPVILIGIGLWIAFKRTSMRT
jgi:TM2 domain-containing membrane protein YozV